MVPLDPKGTLGHKGYRVKKEIPEPREYKARKEIQEHRESRVKKVIPGQLVQSVPQVWTV
jgi:hypothetical protein